MRLTILLLFAATVEAQNSIETGLVRGILVEGATPLLPNQISVRARQDRVYQFAFDRKTWVERDHERILASALVPGETVEVVSDRDLRYARMVHVISKTVAARPPLRAGMYRLHRSPIDEIAPRGDLIFSGIVSQREGGRMVLRTRFDGEKVIWLRPDTRCLEGGFEVESNTLRPNTRVFVRAGKDLDDEIEAYQVIWGNILNPAAPRE